MNIAVVLSLFLGSYLSIVTGQQTYRGNEFFAAFPKNGNFVPLQTPKLHITNSEDTSVLVSITTLLNHQYNIVVQPHSSKSININSQLILDSTTDTNKGIYIKAENDRLISLYATNYVITAAGGYTVLPLHTYNIPEYVYYAFSADTSSMGSGVNSFVALVSGSNDTIVTITPTQTVTIPAELTMNGSIVLTAGTTHTVSLDMMQTLLLSNEKDLTGTRIASNKPLSVISGHECGIVPPLEEYCDQMIQQIPPSVTWGNQYMSMPFATRQSGALFKILTERPNNKINVTCNNITSNQHSTNSFNLTNTGDYMAYKISQDEWCSFDSSEPIIITQYAFSGLQEQIGDPLSMVLTPIEQYTNLKLHDIITPMSLFVDSYSTHKEHIIGIFVLGDEMPENITLDGTTVLDDDNWRAVYNGDDILGYGLAVEGITEMSHNISGSLLSTDSLFVSVIFYGFTAEFNGFGFPVNGKLEPISMPWLITFDQDNYTLIENNIYTIPVHSMNPLDIALSLTVQTCQGTQSLPNVMFDNTINFNPGDSVQFITITALDDNNIEELEFTCLELTAPSNQLAYLYPINQANILIKDDEGLQLSLEEVELINNGLELTVQLSGYEGETNGSVTVVAGITDNINDIPHSLTTITTFNVLFTKYLSELKYLLPFNNTLTVTQDSVISITVLDTQLNVSVGVNNIHLLPPQAPIPTTTSFISSSAITLQSTVVPQMTTSSSQSTTSSVPPSNTDSEIVSTLVTTMVGNSDSVVVDLYVVYLIVALISVLGIVVVILMSTIICFYKTYSRKQDQVCDIEKRTLKKTTQSTAELLGSESVSEPTNQQDQYSQDSAVYTSSFSPNRSDSPGSDESVEPTKIHHLQRLNDIIADEASPRQSIAGSQDNLLEQNTSL